MAAASRLQPLNAPYQAFEATDGWLTIGAANQANWRRLVEVLEAPQLATDPRFADASGRLRYQRELKVELTQIFKQGTLAKWLPRLEEAGVPAGPILNVREMHQNPQTRAPWSARSSTRAWATFRRLICRSRYPRRRAAWRSAPLLGEHTRKVLSKARFSAADVEQLIQEQAVAAAE